MMKMFDINYIMGGKRKTKKTKDPFSNIFPKQKPKPLMSLFTGKGHPNPLDRKTKQQKVFLRRSKPAQRFIDHDRDGVINGLDCMWRNKRKHMARYLSTSNYGVAYGHGISHRDIDPEAYKKENEKRNQTYKQQAVRLSTNPEANWDLGNTNYKNLNKKELVTIHADPDEFEEDMENTSYRKRVMRGIGAIQKVDKYSDEAPVLAQGKRLGDIGGLKKYYGEETPESIDETKWIRTDRAYEMRKKWAGPAGMEVHRSDETMKGIKREITDRSQSPIRTTEEEYEKGTLSDGKHRLIAAKELESEGKYPEHKTYPIRIEKKFEEDEQ